MGKREKGKDREENWIREKKMKDRTKKGEGRKKEKL